MQIKFNRAILPLAASHFTPRTGGGCGWRKAASVSGYLYHPALDLSCKDGSLPKRGRGSNIKALATGTVVYSDNKGRPYGHCVITFDHQTQVCVVYAHLDSRAQSVGDEVTGYSIIGTLGASGVSDESNDDSSHLHIEVSVGGLVIDLSRMNFFTQKDSFVTNRSFSTVYPFADNSSICGTYPFSRPNSGYVLHSQFNSLLPPLKIKVLGDAGQRQTDVSVNPKAAKLIKKLVETDAPIGAELKAPVPTATRPLLSTGIWSVPSEAELSALGFKNVDILAEDLRALSHLPFETRMTLLIMHFREAGDYKGGKEGLVRAHNTLGVHAVSGLPTINGLYDANKKANFAVFPSSKSLVDYYLSRWSIEGQGAGLSLAYQGCRGYYESTTGQFVSRFFTKPTSKFSVLACRLLSCNHDDLRQWASAQDSSGSSIFTGNVCGIGSGEKGGRAASIGFARSQKHASDVLFVRVDKAASLIYPLPFAEVSGRIDASIYVCRPSGSGHVCLMPAGAVIQFGRPTSITEAQGKSSALAMKSFLISKSQSRGFGVDAKFWEFHSIKAALANKSFDNLGDDTLDDAAEAVPAVTNLNDSSNDSFSTFNTKPSEPLPAADATPVVVKTFNNLSFSSFLLL